MHFSSFCCLLYVDSNNDNDNASGGHRHDNSVHISLIFFLRRVGNDGAVILSTSIGQLHMLSSFFWSMSAHATEREFKERNSCQEFKGVSGGYVCIVVLSGIN